MVPVLSNTTVPMRRACSSALALVTSTPLVAPKPSETVTDSGVASPSAHGQAMISTLTAVTSACASCGVGPNDTQMANVQMAMIITAGTKYRAILSASCCTGALVAWARATIAAICESTVSAPTWVARITQSPLSSTVAPVTGSPAVLETGLDSPVIIDSSIRASPATITPSVGTRSPFLTTSRSPVTMASMSVSVKCAGLRHSMPSTLSAEVALSLCAVRGRSLISDCTALPVPSRALASSRRPTSTRVMTTPTDSKYGSREPSGNTHGAMQVTSEYR